MPNPTNLEQDRSIVNPTSTPISAKTVSYRKFEIEMNAKNRAYHFILSNGLFDDFVDFCKKNNSSDPHKDCLDFILSNI